jgi:hypothetical protein
MEYVRRSRAVNSGGISGYAPGMRPARRFVGGLRLFLPVALCALGGHFALYRTLLPSTGEHAYLAWYEPTIAGLSLVSVIVFGVLIGAAAFGRDSLRRTITRLLVPATEQPLPASTRAVRIALSSITFLVTQETIERSISVGYLSPAAFDSSQIVLVLAVVATLATVLAVFERSCSELVGLVTRGLPRPALRLASLSFPAERPVVARRRNLLAELRGLRAPPLAV